MPGMEPLAISNTSTAWPFSAGERQAERLQFRLLAKAENLLAKQELWHAVESNRRELVRNGSISGRAARHFLI